MPLPDSPDRPRNILARILRPEGAAANASRVPGTSLDVLVVDDDGVFGAAVTDVLRKHGYTVLPTDSAEEALEALAQGCTPRVVLLDVGLPGQSAREFLARLREVPRCAHTRVVVTGAADGVARDLGADATLLKPLDGSELLAVMRAQCGPV